MLSLNPFIATLYTKLKYWFFLLLFFMISSSLDIERFVLFWSCYYCMPDLFTASLRRSVYLILFIRMLLKLFFFVDFCIDLMISLFKLTCFCLLIKFNWKSWVKAARVYFSGDTPMGCFLIPEIPIYLIYGYLGSKKMPNSADTRAF